MQPTFRDKIHIVGNGACDYLRCTTFNDVVYSRMEKMWTILAQADVEKHNQSYMQYNGRRMEQGFIGSGMQRGRFAALMEFTGSRADIALESMLDLFPEWPGNIPRMDLQITLQRRESWDNLSMAGRKLREDIKRDKTIRGRKPEIRMVDNSDMSNENTIYIGKRKNTQRMVRIYDKTIGSTEYVRFEIEYHDEMAASVWNELKEKKSTINSVIRAEMMRYANCSEIIKNMIDDMIDCDDRDRMKIVREDRTAEKRLCYLEEQLMAMARKLALEGYSQEVAYILKKTLIDIE